MQKRICLSEYEVKHFYATDREMACLAFGYPPRLGDLRCFEKNVNGICSLCKRLDAFRKQIEEE